MEENAALALDRKLNWLRASVLGANDGIVSIAGVVMGVAASGAGRPTVIVAGVAAVVAGAISMAGGEYTSVSAQRDTEFAHGRPASVVTARPWNAAWSSFLAFTAGALLPLLAITIPIEAIKVPVTVAAVVVALAITGWWAAHVGGGSKTRSIFRNVSVSLLTMGIAYAVGTLLGVTVFA